MPWEPKDATRFTKKAKTPKKKRQFSHVADSMLDRGESEGSAIKAANAVVAGTAKHKGSKKPKQKKPTRPKGLYEK